MANRGFYDLEYLGRLLDETFDSLIVLDPERAEIIRDSYKLSLSAIQRYLIADGNTVSAKRYFRDLIPILVHTTRQERNFGINNLPAFRLKRNYEQR